MNPAETIRRQFALLRKAEAGPVSDHHYNVLYGYVLALRDTRAIGYDLQIRLHQIATRAWANKLDRAHKLRRAA